VKKAIMRKLLLLFITISLLGCEEKAFNLDDIVIVDKVAAFKNDMTFVTGKVQGRLKG
jgi:hypothetical protein